MAFGPGLITTENQFPLPDMPVACVDGVCLTEVKGAHLHPLVPCPWHFLRLPRAVLLQGKALASDVDLDLIARRCPGFTGADLQVPCPRASLEGCL